MGCDIHLFTERKVKIKDKEIWINDDNWKLNPYYEIDGEDKFEVNEVYQHRNYTLFSILADVRNCGENIPICDPKGLPADVSDVVRRQSESLGCDGHSHSYLTMKELNDYYEKNKVVKFAGFVDKEGVKEIEAGRMPKWWCQGSSDKTHVYKGWTGEDTVLADFIFMLDEHFKRVIWFAPYDKKVNQEDFRIVFWFDN